MKILSLFSGIGAFEKALTNMGVKYELVNYCEIDKYASKSYSAIHGVPESKNLGDITKVDTSKLPSDIDLITYGFPCQDISLAGHQRGFEHEGERTRSGLFFEALRLIEDCQPKFAICENVKNLTSKKFEKEFSIVLESLEEAGYKNYWQVLNAKDYGVPQNRERVFIISIREDIDKGYEFPEPFPLELRLKDMLDAEVDEKYYLSNKQIFSMKNSSYIQNQRRVQEKDWCDTLCARDWKDPKCVEVEPKENYVQWDSSGKGYCSQQDRAYYQDGLAPTLSHCNSNGDKSQVVLSNKNDLIEPVCLNSKGGRGGVDGLQPSLQDRVYDSEAISTAVTTSYMPSVLVREATKQGYTEAYEGDSINLEQPNSKTRRRRVGHGVAQTLTTSCNQAVVEPASVKEFIKENNKNAKHQQDLLQHEDDHCRCIPAGTHGSTPHVLKAVVTTPCNNLRIRKLTPKECYLLMGFDPEDYYKVANAGISNSQAYKQAGNSIVVDVIEEIYEQLFKIYWSEIK